MKAVILATGAPLRVGPLDDRRPAPLFPILDKPILQHLVEYLVECGVTQFDIVLNVMPEKVQEAMGDGRRWGSLFRYHLARDAGRPYGLVRTIAHGDAVLVAATHILADVREFLAQPPAESATAFDDAGTGRWTGWMWMPAGTVDAITPGLELPSRHLDIRPPCQAIAVPALSLESFDDFLSGNRVAMTGLSPLLRTPPRAAH